VKLYLCGIDYQHELGECDVKVFESVERLKQMQPCWEQCGIVELQIAIRKVTWIEEQNLFEEAGSRGQKKKKK
jgi:hypothetical protein